MEQSINGRCSIAHQEVNKVIIKLMENRNKTYVLFKIKTGNIFLFLYMVNKINQRKIFFIKLCFVESGKQSPKQPQVSTLPVNVAIPVKTRKKLKNIQATETLIFKFFSSFNRNSHIHRQ